MIRSQIFPVLRRVALPVILTLLCAHFLSQALEEVQTRRGSELVRERNANWAIGQAIFENNRLRRDLDAFAAADPEIGAAEVAHRFDIYWSRIEILKTPSQLTEAISDIARQSGLLLQLQDGLRAMDFIVSGLQRSDPAAVRLLRQEIDIQNLHLQTMDIALRREVERRMDDEYVGANAPVKRARQLFLGLSLSLTGVVLLLLFEIAKSRRLLSTAESARHQAAEAKDSLDTVIDAVPALIAVTDPAGRVLLINQPLRQLHGLEGASIEGRYAAELGIGGTTGSPGGPDSDREPSTGPNEYAVIDKDGRQRTLLGAQVPILGDDGGARRIVYAALDISERKQAEERVSHLAQHDPLTDLPNRGYFYARLRSSLARSGGEHGTLAVLYIDVDRFKAVNDTLGHQAGDILLVELARRMASCLRRNDFLARLGADEFAIIQDGLTDGQQAIKVAARLIVEAAKPFLIGAQEVRIGASIGIYLGSEGHGSAETVMRRADLALYHAKQRNRNCYHVFSPELEEEAARRHGLESDLQRAIERDELFLVYQPKFRASDRALVGFEALLRWRHPERGLVPPDRFIPMAEESGLIVEIGAWVLRTACEHAMAWSLLNNRPVPVSVNLSPVQFSREDVVAGVDAVLHDTGLPPSLLELEITETVLMSNYDHAVDVIGRLRGRGIGVSLDDFGTGYSSLGHLHRLPLDRLKLDRSFVVELTTSETAAAIAGAVVTLAQTLQMRVTAEGVETEAQLHHLQRLGCDEVQGYLLGRPDSIDNAMNLLRLDADQPHEEAAAMQPIAAVG